MIKVLVRELADFFAIEALRRVLKLEWGLGCCSTSLKMPKFWMGTRQICIVQYCVCVYDKEVEQLYIYIYYYYIFIIAWSVASICSQKITARIVPCISVLLMQLWASECLSILFCVWWYVCTCQRLVEPIFVPYPAKHLLLTVTQQPPPPDLFELRSLKSSLIFKPIAAARGSRFLFVFLMHRPKLWSAASFPSMRTV